MLQIKDITQSSTENHNNAFGSESLLNLFDASVKLYREKIAIFHNDQKISYEELDCKSNAIANYLLELNITKGSIVTILLERSINLIVTIVGVLKSGAAYVVIDPDYPINRMQYIFYDTDYVLLLTETCFHEQSKYKYLLETNSSPSVYIEELLINNKKDKINPIQSNGDTLACIIYTSGSTGKPKGVLLPHKAFYRLFDGPNIAQISSSDCIAQIANASFDAFVYEIWSALAYGCSLVIIDKQMIFSPQALETCFEKNNVTTVLFTTSLFNLLVKSRPSIFKTLKNVLFGGEVASSAIVRTLFSNREFKPQRLFNLYGPTECGIVATYYEILSIPQESKSIPIGVPVKNTQVYILNDELQKVEKGEVGELYLGGLGLANGYINLSEFTAEKFIICPFDTSQKLYKTGDLVRELDDGILDFVGRKDNQVKIRGFRVELDEIEIALESHPDIWKGVVLAPYSHRGYRRLIAYFMSKNNGKRIEIKSLKCYLRTILPEYMIPSIIKQLDILPLNSHGKVDRQTLLENLFKI